MKDQYFAQIKKTASLQAQLKAGSHGKLFEKPRMNFKSSTKSKSVKKDSENLCITSSILDISNRAHNVFQTSLLSLLDSYACSLVFKPEGTEQLKVLEMEENLNSVL